MGVKQKWILFCVLKVNITRNRVKIEASQKRQALEAEPFNERLVLLRASSFGVAHAQSQILSLFLTSELAF